MDFLFYIMKRVNIRNTEIFSKIKKRFKKRLGKELSDEEIVDMCLKFTNNHLNLWISEIIRKNIQVDNVQPNEKKIMSFISDILEHEYEEIKNSGKTFKDLIHESWKY